MTPASDTRPAYNVKAVTNETGLAADTLRAWERRYGVPQPGRSPGRQRLYTRRDIELLKWLVARQREGLSISRAVEAFHSLVASGADPLRAPSEPATSAERSGANGALGALSQEWLDACLRFDGLAADAVLSDAFSLHPIERVCTGVLQAAISEVGNRWYSGTATAHQEHFATELATRQIERLIAAAQSPDRDRHILLGCPAGEQHSLGTLLLTLLLRRRGWDAISLGANVPTEDFAATIRHLRPAGIVLSAEILRTAASLYEAVSSLTTFGIAVGYGGRIFESAPSLRSVIPANYLGSTIEGAPLAIERMVSLDQPIRASSIPAEYSACRSHFGEMRAAIEADVLADLARRGIVVPGTSVGVAWLGHDIDAALTLGDLSTLEAEVRWATGLSGVRRSQESIGGLLHAYANAANRRLDRRGEILVRVLYDLADQNAVTHRGERTTEADA